MLNGSGTPGLCGRGKLCVDDSKTKIMEKNVRATARSLALLPPVLKLLLTTGIASVAGILASFLPFEVLVIVLALPGLVGYFTLAVARFDLAVLLLIFCAPLVPTSMGIELSPSLPLITIQRGMLISLYLALILRVVTQRFIFKLPHISPMVWLTLLIYLGANVISSLFTALPLKSLYRTLATLFDNVGLFVIIAFAATSRREAAFSHRTLLVLWASFTILAILGILDTMTGFNLLYYLPAARRGVFVPVYRLGILRGQGLLPHPTALSMVAAIGAVLTMLIITGQQRSSRRMGLWIAMAVHVAALVSSVTRTGWSAFLLGGFFWLVLTKKARVQLILIGLVTFAFLLITGLGTILYATIASGFDISQQNEVSTLLSRIQWVIAVWANVHKEPLRLWFGFGPGTVGYLTTQWTYPGFHANLTTDYLIKLAESGLIGLLSFLMLLLVSVRQSRQLLRLSTAWSRGIGAFFLVAFGQMALGSVTLPLFVWAQTTYIFWILFGILVTIRMPSSRPGYLEPVSHTVLGIAQV